MNASLNASSFAGIHNQPQYRLICLDCLNAGRPATNVGYRYGFPNRSRRDRICLTCDAGWSVSHCWSCQVHWIDSRDPQTPPCLCGWLKCAACGACDWHGCRERTNPYRQGFTYRDALIQGFVASEEPGDGPDGQDDWQRDADSGWESYVGVSRDDPDWDMMEEIVLDAMFERSERD